MDISGILKALAFLIIFGLFFASDRVQNIFTSLKNNIALSNTEFFSNMPTEIIFFFGLFIFLLIFAFILSFFK